MKNSTTNTLFLLFCFIFQLNAQPEIEWEINIGGSDWDFGKTVLEVPSGGYMILGSARSVDIDVTTNNGNIDVWLVKIDINGNIEWEKNYGGGSDEYGRHMVSTSDGGYLIAANSRSNDIDVSGNIGVEDLWLIKISAAGDIEWDRNYGSTGIDDVNRFIETNDGGYLIAGHKYMPATVEQAGWFLKIDAIGNLEWEQLYTGASAPYTLIDVKSTSDGGFIAVGTNLSSDFNLWVIKTDQNGVLDWERTYGGSENDLGRSVETAPDGDFLVVGKTFSSDGDVTSNFDSGAWILKLDAFGDLIWDKTIGGAEGRQANVITRKSNGDFLLVGTSIFNEDSDGWIVNIDADGNVLWQNQFGGSDLDIYSDIKQTTDGGCIVVGSSKSSDGDVSGNNGDLDFWIVKLEAFATDVVTISNDVNFSIQPNPSNGNFRISTEKNTSFEVTIVDILGKQIFKETVQNSSFEVTGIESGIYWVNIVGDGVEVSEKLVVVK